MLDSMKLAYNMFQYQFFKNMHSYLSIIFLGFLYACTGVVAHAAAEYEVTPMVINLKAEARDIIEREITIENTGTQNVTLYPTVNNISLEGSGEIHEFIPPVMSDRTQSLASWVEVSRMGIDIKVGETKTIPFTVRINPGAIAGTYHTFIGFGTGDNRDQAEQHVMSGKAGGTIVTLEIEEKKSEFLKLSGFIVDRFVTDAANQAAVYTFENPSGETLTPKGEIIFYDNRGVEVASVPVNEENVQVPAGGTHVFKTQVPVENLFGKYKAFLSVEYGTKQRASLQDTSFFYIFPVKMLLIVLGVVMLLVAIGSWYVHKKYFDEEEVVDDSERLMVHVRDGVSDEKHHDIDLKKKS